MRAIALAILCLACVTGIPHAGNPVILVVFAVATFVGALLAICLDL